MEEASVIGSASRRSSGDDAAVPVGVSSPDAVANVAELASSSLVLLRENIIYLRGQIPTPIWSKYYCCSEMPVV